MSPRLFQDFRDGYIRLSSLTVEHSIAVMAQDESILNPMGSQFSILVFIKFCERFYIRVQYSGTTKFSLLPLGWNTYLLFNSNIVKNLCMENL